MIILGWIGVVLLFIVFVAVFAREKHETYPESFINASKAVAGVLTAISAVVGLIYLFVLLMIATFGTPLHRELTPTVLSCNGVIVAESVKGFVYNSKGSAYEDYRNNLTYTPRQGEVCKEYLKGSE